MGLRIVLADVDEPKLAVAATEVGAIVGEANVIPVVTDVSKLEDVEALKERALDAFGEVRIRIYASRLTCVADDTSVNHLTSITSSVFNYFEWHF
jgi:NAD(P)-dependent dehydrogenase (short-subunit alcohol dehydrogenase family)